MACAGRHADWSCQVCRSCGGAPMSGYEAHPPRLVPVLSRGKHRSPRKGACFMELASYLAGERWSDHPACTRPLLAAVARDVNDYTSDAGRARLAELIPSVIGLAGDDLHLDARIALRCARMALPVVAAERQRVMAMSVLVCERVLAGLDGRPAGWLEEQSRAALARVPHAAQWARGFIATSRSPRRSSAGAPHPPRSTPRRRGSRRRACRSPMTCSVTCSPARSATAPPGPARTPASPPRATA